MSASKLYKPRDVMIDIETLATSSNAAVIQIGACTFDEKSEFLVSIDPNGYDGRCGLEEWHDKDYRIDERTVAWWEEQGEAARESLQINQVANPSIALHELEKWLKSTGFQKSYRTSGRSVWANGVQFDISILRYMYLVERGDNNATPWHYRQEKDLRTLFRLFANHFPKGDMNRLRRGLVKHRADHDCIAQVRSLRKILDSLVIKDA